MYVYSEQDVDPDIHEWFLNTLRNWLEEPGTGWHFGVGDPESWRYRNRLFVPGGDLFDIGIGLGRASLCFAHWGMNVEGVDKNATKVEALQNFATTLKLPLHARSGDICGIDFGENKYDTVLIVDVFIHFWSKVDAYLVIDRAINAVKVGGHLVLRAIGKHDSHYEALRDNLFAEVVNEDCIMSQCSCSGRPEMEPHLFFDQHELLAYLMNDARLRIIHSQVVSQRGKANLMFGENWQWPISSFERSGAMTFIVQRVS